VKSSSDACNQPVVLLSFFALLSHSLVRFEYKKLILDLLVVSITFPLKISLHQNFCINSGAQADSGHFVSYKQLVMSKCKLDIYI